MTTIKQLSTALPALLLILLLCTCDRAQPHEEGDGHDHDAPTEKMASDDHDGHDHDDEHGDHEEEEGIHLTTAQIETMDIGFGDFTDIKINDYVTATGTMDLPPNGYADVSARATGFVRNSRNYVEGAAPLSATSKTPTSSTTSNATSNSRPNSPTSARNSTARKPYLLPMPAS